MKRARFSEEQIIGILKAAEAVGNIREACRENIISEQTLYHWRWKYGGMDVSEARRLKELERENGELVHSVKDDQVQQILASLISTTKINDSAILAGHVQEHLHSSIKKRYSHVKDLGVKEGPFFVLHDTNMPSILVEVGFITNSREEKRLRKSAYLDRLAASIARGIHEFKKDRGPTI